MESLKPTALAIMETVSSVYSRYFLAASIRRERRRFEKDALLYFEKIWLT